RLPKANLVLADTRPRRRQMQQDGTEWASLLAAAQAGDTRAMARFLTAVTPLIRAVVRARGRSLPPDQHEDVVQDVLLAIHLKRDSWQPGAPLRPWLYAVTRYKVIDAFRRRGSRVHLPVHDFAEIIADPRHDDPMASRDLAVLLARIDPRSAGIVRAMGLEGEAAEDVAARLGMTGGAVRVALHRAMKKLSEIGLGTKE
ncbi:sigma-70 family RNA polymerase sigma factor, partial [Paracoccus nototheniae]